MLFIYILKIKFLSKKEIKRSKPKKIIFDKVKIDLNIFIIFKCSNLL
jgi:hypothetical protein